MKAEKEYVQYGLTLILTVLGISATYLVDFSNPVTFIAFLFLPMLYGHTAFISRHGFNKASLLSLTALIFSVVGGVTGFMSIIYGFGNVFVSIFAGGSRMRDYFGAVSIPLVLAGLLMGTAVYGYGNYNNQFKQETLNQASSAIGIASEKAVEDSNIAEIQKRNQLSFVNQTSRSSTILTSEIVLNRSNPSNEVRSALRDAKVEVPELMYQRTKARIEEADVQTKERVTQAIQNAIGENYIIIIPFTAFLLITLQPLIGILTAISAESFSRISNL